MRKLVIVALVTGLAVFLLGMASTAVDTSGVSIAGKVVDEAGKPLAGATVSAFSNSRSHSVSVYSRPDGSFQLSSLPMGDYEVRARLIGRKDAWQNLGHVHQQSKTRDLQLAPAVGLDLQWQRPANDLLDLLPWENEADALNFKMMCTYCHQVGTLGFRSPEEPVDWEVMLTRMDGYQGLYKHTQDTLVDRIVKVFGRDAEKAWPAYQAPPAPSGDSLNGRVDEWTMGKENDAMIHDLEYGPDGVIYTVDMTSDAVETLDPRTGEHHIYSVPGGKEYDSPDRPIKGPHSIENHPDGSLWITLALSGEMGRFDPKTKGWHVVPAHEAPRPRGGYPHTLRVDQQGTVWFTDAALGVFSLDGNLDKYDAAANRFPVKFYRLPSADQVQGGGARGESRGVTPYGIDVAPNGQIWYTKLNGQRIGRLDPKLADDDPKKILEWEPPVHGPRRLHLAPNGLVWVPGWASGDIASFDPSTEEWAVYPLPHGPNSLPYALNVNPVTGDVWVCGTGTDSMLRFDPKTRQFSEYRMPTRVTYTREIEFDPQGGVWTVNSNYPVRHVENGHGSVIHVTVGGL